MELIVVLIPTVLGGLVAGALLSYFVRVWLLDRRREAAKSEAEALLESAREERRGLLLEANESALQARSAAESEIKGWRAELRKMEQRLAGADTEIRERRSDLQKTEQRLVNREENSERRAANLDRREQALHDNEDALESVRAEVEQIKESQLAELESVSALSLNEARDLLMRRAEEEVQHELALRYRDAEERAREEAEGKARRILSQSIHRLASDVVSEVTVTTVPLPSDDMKGRLIGREGRNIKAISGATGVDLIIDDMPEAVTLSSFDPIRREVARVAVTKLMADGRIHPARIEDMVAKAEKEVNGSIWKSGEEAVFDTGVRGLHPEIVKLLGRLRYRYSYGENVLQHCLEVSHLAGMIAAEVGADVNIAKSGGLLHDVGKALTHEVEGPHADIGGEIAAKYEVSGPVCACIREHHDDDMSSVESFIVAASDAISAARPGARRDSVEAYMKRLDALEDVGRAFDGVEKCFAIQAGREIRIMVQPESIDDVAASKMARDIVKKIEDTLVYPGQIKVTVIRESRSVEFAR